jgi:hypothetical protein
MTSPVRTYAHGQMSPHKYDKIKSKVGGNLKSQKQAQVRKSLVKKNIERD